MRISEEEVEQLGKDYKLETLEKFELGDNFYGLYLYFNIQAY